MLKLHQTASHMRMHEVGHIHSVCNFIHVDEIKTNVPTSNYWEVYNSQMPRKHQTLVMQCHDLNQSPPRCIPKPVIQCSSTTKNSSFDKLPSTMGRTEERIHYNPFANFYTMVSKRYCITNFMEFIIPYIILSSKPYIVWSLCYFKITSIFLGPSLKKKPFLDTLSF